MHILCWSVNSKKIYNMYSMRIETKKERNKNGYVIFSIKKTNL